MNTPIYDFLSEYAEKNKIRLHMPGHHGKSFDNKLSKLFPLDITEINGADSLFDAYGIIKESEDNASALFNTEKTLYSVQGSTLCIQTMLALMKAEKRNVIAVRNVHRSFINACILLDLNVTWIYPEYDKSFLSGDIPVHDIEKALADSDSSCCLYVTSPDYLGKMCDIKTLSAICRKYNAALLVDNAHGSHTAFFNPSIHPIALGADMCCDSAHKTLPAMTGGAYLHIGNKRYEEHSKQFMSMFASTSPSYLIMASLDLCNKYISEKIHEDIERCLRNISILKERLKNKYSFYDGEPFHLTITDIDGLKLADKLRTLDAECEYADSSCVVLLLSPVMNDSDFNRLYKLLDSAWGDDLSVCGDKVYLCHTEQAMPMREAAFAKSEIIPVSQSVGRICAGVIVPCPPAVPVAVSGEIITENCVNIFKKYGIELVSVVK